MKIKGLRWWIIGLICLGTIINYLARNSLSVMAPTLKETLHFSTQEYSYIVAAFQVAYCFMQPVAGFVLDFLGLRIGYFVFALFWSAFVMLHGTATSWAGLATWRGLLGMAEASALPAGVKCVGEWFPAKERSQAVGWFNAGTSIGAMLAPPLIIFVAMQYNWQMAFVVPGLLGIVWAFLWLYLYRGPQQHWWISNAERDHIVSGQTPPSSEKVSVKEIVTKKKFWAIALPRFLAEPAWQTFNFWIPLYLVTERGMESRRWRSLPGCPS